MALIGWGVDLIPSNKSWIPSSIIWGLAFLWAVVVIISSVGRRGKVEEAKEEGKEENLVDVLNKMHKRMLYLKDVKVSKTRRVELGKIEADGAILMDKLGLVPLDKWDKFKKDMQRRIRKAWGRKRKGNWYFKMLCEASEIRRELCESKAWTIDDGLVVCEWLEERHWGIREMRDKDKVWKDLFESINEYLAVGGLSELIMKHIKYSYVGCSMLLISAYTRKKPGGIFLNSLHSVLVGSPVDPVNIEAVMGEVIGEVKRGLRAREHAT